VTVTASKMTDAEAHAYDMEQQKAALNSTGNTNCTVAMTFQEDTTSSTASASATVSPTGPAGTVSGSGTLLSPGNSTTITCPPGN
jgi:hypothetical protein